MSANNTTNSFRIKRSILLPLFCGLFSLMLLASASFYWQLSHQINQEVKSELGSIEHLYTNLLRQQEMQIESLFDYFKNDPALQKSFLAKDRKGLLEAARPFHAKINGKYDITHFYFITPDKNCFLRVHQPDRHDDIINRFTLARAIQDNKTAAGIELGPLGTFTLRVVQPWLIHGELAGYLELGREIKFILPELKKIHNLELITVISKSFLNRPQWQDRQKMMGTGSDWNYLPNHVMIESTLEDIPGEIIPHLHAIHSEHEHQLFNNIRVQDHHYRTGFITLKDAGGREVGDIIPLFDITAKRKALNRHALLMLTSGFIVGAILFFLFSRHINGLEKRLSSQGEKLRQARKEWENTFAAIPDIVCLLDKNLRILRVNEAACKITNKTADQLVGQICHDLFRSSGSAPCPDCPMLKTVDDFQPHTAEISNGNLKKTLLVTASPVLDDLGQLVSIIHVARDITKLKKMEEQLRQSLKMEAVGRLAGGVAHDFNNLLTTILGYSELLIMDLDKDSPVSKSLKTIYEAGEKAAALTHQLLAFSRKQDIELKPVDLDQVITQMGKMLTRVIPEDIHLELRPHAGQRII